MDCNPSYRKRAYILARKYTALVFLVFNILTHLIFNKALASKENESFDSLYITSAKCSASPFRELEEFKELRRKRCANQIDDVEYSIKVQEYLYFEEQRNAKSVSHVNESFPDHFQHHFVYSPPRLGLKQYQQSRQTLKAMLKRDPSHLGRLFNLDEYSKKNGFHEIGLEEDVWTLYSPYQIRRMSSLLKNVLSVMTEARSETSFIFDNPEKEKIIIKHSIGDHYRLGVRYFHQQRNVLINEHRQTSAQAGFIPLHFIAAAIITGDLTHEDVQFLKEDQYFFQKKESQLKQFLSYLGRLTLLGLQLNKSTAVATFIGVLLFQTFQTINGLDELEMSLDEAGFYFTTLSHTQNQVPR
jgi:hypothetical protein